MKPKIQFPFDLSNYSEFFLTYKRSNFASQISEGKDRILPVTLDRGLIDEIHLIRTTPDPGAQQI